MSNRTHRYVAIIAITALLPLTLGSIDALAKSSQSKSRDASVAGNARSAATRSHAMMIDGPTGYSYPSRSMNSGVVSNNTAGWGNLGQ